VKSKPGWEQGPSRLAQAADVLRQAPSSAGFTGLRGPGVTGQGSTPKEKSFHQCIPCSGGFNTFLKCGRQSLIPPKLSKSCSPGEVP